MPTPSMVTSHQVSLTTTDRPNRGRRVDHRRDLRVDDLGIRHAGIHDHRLDRGRRSAVLVVDCVGTGIGSAVAVVVGASSCAATATATVDGDAAR